MNLFSSIVASLIIMLFPVLCYLFYIVSDKNIDDKKRKTVFNFMLLSIFYIVSKFNFNTVYIFLLLSIPIYIADNKKIVLTKYLMLFTLIFVASKKDILPFTILEIILMYIFNKNRNKKIYIIIMVLCSLSYTFIYDINNVFYNTIFIIVFFIYTNIIFYTLTKGEDIIDYHIEYKDLKKENEIRKSLFKISHEIKNPLAVCKAYVDIFDYRDIIKSKKYINIISGEIDKMLLLLQDFLLVNKDNIKFDIMDINLLLEEISSSLYDIHKLKVILNVNDDEIYINGDYNRLNQVITNMVKNSYEANSTKVIIKSYLNEKNVIVEVIDNGSGIDKNISDKIYEPFFTTKKDGTGLGVSLSNEIVEAHGGTLKYFDNKNKGTIAKISLPIIDY